MTKIQNKKQYPGISGIRAAHLFRILNLKSENVSKRGISLIETVVYVGLVGMIVVFITNSLIQILSTYQRARAEREVVSNARLVMETVVKNISYARDVYTPTSRFNTNTGQLSLITPLDPLTEHTTSYIDFWTDGNALLMRREGTATSTLSSTRVKITQFRVEQISQALGRRAVKITLGVSSTALVTAASTTLNATAALRGNY